MSEASSAVNSQEWWNHCFLECWAAADGSGQTRHFMQRLIENLPAPERQWLESGARTILDWGCAFGEGVQFLAEQFPNCSVSGTDFASAAIEEARRLHPAHQFGLSENGEIPQTFDCIVVSNCLEHFAEPFALAAKHLAVCRYLYLILVPYREWPLHESHVRAFDDWSFPERLGEFTRIFSAPFPTDPTWWRGSQLLVIYASPAYLQERPHNEAMEVERVNSELDWRLRFLSDELINREMIIDARDEAIQSLNAEVKNRDKIVAARDQDIQALSEESKRRSQIIAARDQDIQALSQESKRLTQTIQALSDESKRRVQIIAARDEAIQYLQDRIKQFETDRQSVSLRQIIAELQATAEQSAVNHLRDLRRAEELRSRTFYGLNEYTARLEQQRAVIRDQRAWRVMLAVRKAYELLFRRGSSGKLELARWLARIPFAGFGDLTKFEIEWPEIDSYLPENVREPFSGAWGLPAISTPAHFAPVPGSDADLPAGAAPQTSYDVLILAIIDFDFRFQRPQQIAAQFASQGHRVFWISPSRFLHPGSSGAYSVWRLRENIWEIHLRARHPDVYLGTLEPDMLDSLTESLAEVYRDFAISESCVLVQLPFWRQVALAVRAAWTSPIVYDCMDDWDSFRNMGPFNGSEERELARECDLLLVTAAALATKFQDRGLHPLLARNASDFEFFQTAAPNSLLKGIPKPIVGYFGAIADWIDLDLIAATAGLRPEYSFVLIGGVHNRDTSQLEALPNIFLLGRKNYADIPSYLYGFDVCTIPFLLNDVTHATDPVKLYEYFSLGKPVVATDMPELEQCAGLLYIANDAERFARQIDAALAETDSSLAVRRREFAQANTWTSRIADIDAALRPIFPLVSILIVTYNSAKYIDLCLDSIRRNTSYPNYEVIVVDNHSTDATPDLLVKHDQVRIHLLDSNQGFAAANNFAARQASGEHLVLLNADTMVTSGWIQRLLRHLRADSGLGLISPVTNYAGNEIKVNVTYRNRRQMEEFAIALARNKQGQSLDIPMAPLFCALVSRALWNQIGGLDESFEIGMFEDDDFSHRVRQAGLRIAAAEDCFIHHFGQGSFSMLPPKDYNDLFERNRTRFERKWKITWQPHEPRPGVRPAFEETPYRTADFLD